MKLFKLGLSLALFAAVCLPAVAQTELHFNIPFNFVAAGKTMPAGDYKVMPAFHNVNNAWSLIGSDGSVTLLTNSVESAKAAHKCSLVFLRAGGQFSLTQIWSSDPKFGREVMRSNVKRSLLAKGGEYVEVRAE